MTLSGVMSTQLLLLEGTLCGSGPFVLDIAHLFLCSAFSSSAIAAYSVVWRPGQLKDA